MRQEVCSGDNWDWSSVQDKEPKSYQDVCASSEREPACPSDEVYLFAGVRSPVIKMCYIPSCKQTAWRGGLCPTHAGDDSIETVRT